jgi:hypothetical protein
MFLAHAFAHNNNQFIKQLPINHFITTGFSSANSCHSFGYKIPGFQKSEDISLSSQMIGTRGHCAVQFVLLLACGNCAVQSVLLLACGNCAVQCVLLLACGHCAVQFVLLLAHVGTVEFSLCYSWHMWALCSSVCVALSTCGHCAVQSVLLLAHVGTVQFSLCC